MRETLVPRLERVILRPVPTSLLLPNLEAIRSPTYVVRTPRNFRLAPKGPAPALPPTEPVIKAARAPKVALPEITVVGLSVDRDATMWRCVYPTHKRVATR